MIGLDDVAMLTLLTSTLMYTSSSTIFSVMSAKRLRTHLPRIFYWALIGPDDLDPIFGGDDR